MTTIPISDVVAMPAGSNVSGVKGTVTNAYPPKSGKNGQYQSIMLEQDGHKIKTMLWGHSMVGKINQGQDLLILSGGDGSIKTNTYNQSPQLGVNEKAKISIDSGGGSESSAGTTSSAPSGSVSSDMDLNQLTDVYIVSAKLIRQKAIKAGLSEKVADQMAVNVNSWIPEWWFGQKSVKMPQPPLYKILAKKAGVTPAQANDFIRDYCAGEHGDVEMDHKDLQKDDIDCLLSAASIKSLRMISKKQDPEPEPEEEDHGFDDESDEPF